MKGEKVFDEWTDQSGRRITKKLDEKDELLNWARENRSENCINRVNARENKTREILRYCQIYAQEYKQIAKHSHGIRMPSLSFI